MSLKGYLDELSHKEKASIVVVLLSDLILHNQGMLAREQYCPGADVDASDEIMKQRAEWVKELRRIRGEFEDLVTGVVK